MAEITINGVRLYAKIKGNGFPLLLIHVLGGDSSQMDIVAEPLVENNTVISYDCRGHGRSEKPSSYTIQDHINDALALMDHYGFTEFNLLGVSMGSYIAQGIAIAAPHRIKKLLLTVPKSNGLTSSVARLMKENSDHLKGMSFHEIVLYLLKYMVYDPEKMKNHVDLFEGRLSPHEFAAANKALENFDFRPGLEKITAKTLVISGKYDQLNPPDEDRICAQLISNAKFIEMSYSGHAPMYEEPERYLQIVKDFLTPSGMIGY